jgi:hypothetical protein
MRDPEHGEVVVVGERVAAEQLAAMLRGVLGEIDAGRLAGDPAHRKGHHQAWTRRFLRRYIRPTR